MLLAEEVWIFSDEGRGTNFIVLGALEAKTVRFGDVTSVTTK